MILDEKIKLIILGETHGTKENIEVISRLIKEFNIKTVCFEWNPQWFDKNFELKKGLNLMDGRYLKEHADFVEKVKDNIKIHCVDTSSESDSWNQRDKKIVKNVKRISKQSQGTVLLVVGNLHARKVPFFLKPYSTEKFIPTGFYLKNQAVCVKVCYAEGSIFNYSIRHVSDKRLKTYFSNKHNVDEFHWHKTKSKFFDYELWLRHAYAGQPIKF